MQGGKQANSTGKIKKGPCIIFFSIVVVVILVISLLVIFLVVLAEYQNMHKIITLTLGEVADSKDASSKLYTNKISNTKLSRQYSYLSIKESDATKMSEETNKDYVSKAVDYGYADIFLFDFFLDPKHTKNFKICTEVRDKNDARNYRSRFAGYEGAFKSVCEKDLEEDKCKFEFGGCDVDLNDDNSIVAKNAYMKAQEMADTLYNKDNESFAEAYRKKVPGVTYIRPPYATGTDSKGDLVAEEEDVALLMYFYEYVETCVKDAPEGPSVDIAPTDPKCRPKFCSDGKGEGVSKRAKYICKESVPASKVEDI